MTIYKIPMSEVRKDFESWLLITHGIKPVRTRKGYIDNTIRIAWRAWQESKVKYTLS